MEATAAGVAFVPLLSLCYETAKRLRKYRKSSKYAEKDINDIVSETNLFTSLLKSLQTIIREAERTRCLVSLKTADLNICAHIIQNGRRAMNEVGELLDDLTPLRVGANVSFFKTFVARIRWNIRQDNFKKVQTSMDAVKSNALVFLELLRLKELVIKCQRHAETNQEIPDHLRKELFVAEPISLEFENTDQVIERTIAVKSETFEPIGAAWRNS